MSDGIMTLMEYMLSRYRELGLELGEIAEVPVCHLASRHNTPQGCYENAYRVAADHKGALYVLGYVLVCDVPVEHAWVKLPDGSYVDSTLAGGDYRYYRVLEIGNEELLKVTLKYRYFPALCDVLRYRHETKGAAPAATKRRGKGGHNGS